MGDRASFLRAWFSALEDRGVSWACLRNATEVFGPGPSDVDLLVAQRHQRNFLATLEEVADRQKARLLQDTRFASASRVYRPTEGSPFRIDFEHQLAWRGFPVLPADALLARRQRQEIWVLDPTDELAVLILTAVWRGQLSPRYRARILALRAQTRDPGKIAGILRQAFGAAGPKIEEALARLTRGEDASLPLGEIRAALMRRALGNPRHTVPWIKNLAGDIFRFGERWRHPPGLVLGLPAEMIQSHRAFWEAGAEKLSCLFPREKWCWRPAGVEGRSLASKVGDFLTVFRGGVVVRASGSITTCGKLPRICVACGPDEKLWLGYSPAGTMAPGGSARPGSDPSWGDGVFELLGRSPLGRAPSGRRRGQWMVLVGLDGSGKTTLARHLLEVAPNFGWDRLRYGHFLPPRGLLPEFPWPTQEKVPRKKALAAKGSQRVLSLVRLARNLLRAQGLRFLALRRNRPDLLVLDRYLYNYWLDPVSVRFVGSSAVVEKALHWIPRPDLVVVLRARPELLASRKGELSREEMARQEQLLESLPLKNVPVLELDSGRPPQELAELCCQRLADILKSRSR